MKSAYLPFIIFLLLFLSTMPLSFDAATSVVPGWHMSIFPPWFIAGTGVTIVLFLILIGYWLLANRGVKPKPILLISHIALTVPVMLYLKFPGILLRGQLNNEDELLQIADLNMKVAITTLVLFVLGLVLFIIYFIRAIKINHQATVV